MQKVYVVRLSREDREQLDELVKRGKARLYYKLVKACFDSKDSRRL